MLRTRVAGRKLALESLENRLPMAGNISAMVTGQTLRIIGDDDPNGVAITYDAAAKSYQVVGLDAGGEMTRVNGKDTSIDTVSFRRISRIVIETRGGDDIIDLGGDDVRLSQYLTINAGAGSDLVTLGSAGNAGDLDNLPAELRIGTSLTVTLGEGEDRLELANLIVGTHVRIDAGAGDDEIDFATDYVIPAEGEGEDVTIVAPIRIGGSLIAQLGAGLDQVDARNATIRGRLQIIDVAGAAEIDLSQLKVGGRVDLQTSDEVDLIALDFVLSQGLSVITNGGADEVTIDNSRFRTMSVRLGAEFDDLAISETRVSVSTTLDGGDDSGLFINGPGNVLRKLRKLRLFDA